MDGAPGAAPTSPLELLLEEQDRGRLNSTSVRFPVHVSGLRVSAAVARGTVDRCRLRQHAHACIAAVCTSHRPPPPHKTQKAGCLRPCPSPPPHLAGNLGPGSTGGRTTNTRALVHVLRSTKVCVWLYFSDCSAKTPLPAKTPLSPSTIIAQPSSGRGQHRGVRLPGPELVNLVTTTTRTSVRARIARVVLA